MRSFDLGDILSITTGRMVSTTGMQGIYQILSYMAADAVFTHAIPRVMRECAPHLLEQHPQLAAVNADAGNVTDWSAWLDEQKAVHGNELPVKPLPKHAHEFIDPLSELAEKVHPDRIVVAGGGSGEKRQP